LLLYRIALRVTTGDHFEAFGTALMAAVPTPGERKIITTDQ
jgi:hypothetical protein